MSCVEEILSIFYLELLPINFLYRGFKSTVAKKLIFKKKSPLSLIHGKSLKGTLAVIFVDLLKYVTHVSEKCQKLTKKS